MDFNYKPSDIVMVKTSQHRRADRPEVPAIVTKVEGSDVFYRTIRSDGALNREDSIHKKSGRIRPAPIKEVPLRE